jgi:1-aminocyclopropane-1-carboxylate deaminase/D-cysteine desulfhydrase-like pyridoxal-dependent ACC family enzyme
LPEVGAARRLFIKRDDLLHPVVEGTKWRKLEAAITEMREKGYAGLLTFGGPFSNHLHATAAAGKALGFPTVGIVRGLAADRSNVTLQFAAACGMQLFAVSKKSFDAKDGEVRELVARFSNYLYVPEGGATPAAALHCRQLAAEIARQLQDYGIDPGREIVSLAVSAGTGCTAAGLAAGWNTPGQVLIFPAAPYALFEDPVRALLPLAFPIIPEICWMHQYTDGKFARLTAERRVFAESFLAKTGILLDPIYTVKMMYGLLDLLQRDWFPPKAVIVAVHTGGLQGWAGFQTQ